MVRSWEMQTDVYSTMIAIMFHLYIHRVPVPSAAKGYLFCETSLNVYMGVINSSLNIRNTHLLPIAASHIPQMCVIMGEKCNTFTAQPLFIGAI